MSESENWAKTNVRNEYQRGRIFVLADPEYMPVILATDEFRILERILNDPLMIERLSTDQIYLRIWFKARFEGHYYFRIEMKCVSTRFGDSFYVEPTRVEQTIKQCMERFLDRILIWTIYHKTEA